MRTTKRFTPKVLERFERTGRGTGTFADYQPWHQISRGDPSSRGRSHWHIWKGRQLHLLSDIELIGVLFFLMWSSLSELLEQYVLTQERGTNPLLPYGIGDPTQEFAGTEEIARQLGVRHPEIHDKSHSVRWSLSSDIVGIDLTPRANTRLIVASIKDATPLTKRKIALLRIEKIFWELRGAVWLLITPTLYHPEVKKNLEKHACWTLIPTSAEDILVARELTYQNSHLPLMKLIQLIGHHLGSIDLAQRALWQAVWASQLPVDLARPIRPGLPLKLLSDEGFKQLNPITSFRSAWKWN